MALKQIKNKIISTKKTGKVTKAMESVSAVKMRKSQERALGGRPYVHAALRILKRLADGGDGLSHPLMQARADGATLLVIITSDKGLAGSVNSAVLKQAEAVLRTHQDVSILAIGRKAVEFARREKRELLGEYVNVSDGVTLHDVYAIANDVIANFTNHALKTYKSFTKTLSLPLSSHQPQERYFHLIRLK
jgi:F-type H+-transporting ATPase subunit gamma